MINMQFAQIADIVSIHYYQNAENNDRIMIF